VRSINERAAINARLQGTAPKSLPPRHDTRERVAKKLLGAQMLLQVQDETDL